MIVSLYSQKFLGNNYISYYHSTVIPFHDMANQDSPIWERLGMDHNLSPLWTLLNIAKAIKAGLFAQPSEQILRKDSAAYQMVNNSDTIPTENG